MIKSHPTTPSQMHIFPRQHIHTNIHFVWLRVRIYGWKCNSTAIGQALVRWVFPMANRFDKQHNVHNMYILFTIGHTRSSHRRMACHTTTTTTTTPTRCHNICVVIIIVPGKKYANISRHVVVVVCAFPPAGCMHISYVWIVLYAQERARTRVHVCAMSLPRLCRVSVWLFDFFNVHRLQVQVIIGVRVWTKFDIKWAARIFSKYYSAVIDSKPRTTSTKPETQQSTQKSQSQSDLYI